MLIKVDLRLPLPCLFYLYGTGYIAGLRYPSSTMAPVGYDKRELDTSKCSALHTFRATRDLWLTLMLAGDFAPEHFWPATLIAFR